MNRVYLVDSTNPSNVKNKAISTLCRYLSQATLTTVFITISNSNFAALHNGVKKYFNYIKGLGPDCSEKNYEAFLDSSYFRRGCSFTMLGSSYTDKQKIMLHMLYKELSKKIPVPVTIRTSSGGEGHAIVCDGYRKSDKKFHLNFGWYGKCNGYYPMDPYDYNWNNDNALIGSAYTRRQTTFRFYPNEYYNDDLDVNYNKITFTENGGTNSSIIVVAHSWNSTTKKLTYTNHDTWDIEGFTGTQYTPSNASWLTIEKDTTYKDKIILTAT
jgi:hypothetical protein